MMTLNLDWLMPDPAATPHDARLTEAVRQDLAFLPGYCYVWVDEDGRIFIDTPFVPLSVDQRQQIEAAGYAVPRQPGIVVGSRVQYKLGKREDE